jgi:NADPH:quinone reductase-like Zn-dependent oxidoreductase
MTTIRKLVVPTNGPPSVIEVVQATIEAPPRGTVQVRVAYAAFSGADVAMRLGKYPLQRAAPLTLGYCFVGRVVSSGPGCKREWKAGTVVSAVSVYDAQAEMINVAEKYLVAAPDALATTDEGLQQVVAVSLDWSTAYGMVDRAAAVQPNQRVFVHGLSGSVGHALLALCKLRGATVYGTASARNHDELRRKGAIPFLYTDKRWIAAMKQVGGVHAVFDPLGFESWDESYSILVDRSGEKGGILVGYGGNKATLEGTATDGSVYPTIAKLFLRGMNPLARRRTTFYYIDRDNRFYEPDFKAALELVARGEVRASVKAVLELTTESLREAHERFGKIEGIGAILVRP